MTRAIAVLSGSTAVLLHNPFSYLGRGLVCFWHALTHDAAPAYRPERHYMRGPGPAWHAKHGQTPSA